MKNDCSYSDRGGYEGYNKNNKEREKNDYYATPPCESLNILQELSLNLDGCAILDTSMGQGHLLLGVQEYLKRTHQEAELYGTDLFERKTINGLKGQFAFGKDYDVLLQSYSKNIEEFTKRPIDYIIINPPFKHTTPFVKTAFKIAKKGVLIFGRIQFLEGIQRYSQLHKIMRPDEIYGYIERIACYKNGEKPNNAGVQMYAWYYYDMEKENSMTKYCFLHKYNKQHDKEV